VTPLKASSLTVAKFDAAYFSAASGLAVTEQSGGKTRHRAREFISINLTLVDITHAVTCSKNLRKVIENLIRVE